MAKWAVKLSVYDISYLPRPAMKAQVLVDFLVKCTADKFLPEEGRKLCPAEAKSSAEVEHPFDSAEAESEAIPENT